MKRGFRTKIRKAVEGESGGKGPDDLDAVSTYSGYWQFDIGVAPQKNPASHLPAALAGQDAKGRAGPVQASRGIMVGVGGYNRP